MRSQALVRSKLNPKNFLKIFIQLPGLGRRINALGNIPVKIKGKARPSPMNENKMKIFKGVVVKAKVRAVPSSGALQGVDKITARMPPAKSANNPSLRRRFPINLPPGVLNSKSPNILREKIKRASVMRPTKEGDWS